jgi:DNA polymerase-3 subunit gamma/tau
MLYVKYRPEYFKEIIRPNLEIDNLLLKLKKGNLGHAHIICGSRGVGKTTTARLLAKGLNCLQFTDDLCGTCENCVSIKDGKFLDIIEIDGASNRRVEDARELRDLIKFPPLKGKKKVIIIDEVHMLTNEAFNTLLKSIEEPPVFLTFILCTTEPQKIPETIRSRCQITFLSRPTDSQIVEKLHKIAEKERIVIDASNLESIARASNGAYRDAETLLTQFQDSSSLELMENYYSVNNFIKYLDLVLRNDCKNLLIFHKNLEMKGIDLVKWLSFYISFLRTVLNFGIEKIVIRENKFNLEDRKRIETILSGVSLKNLTSHIVNYIDFYSQIKFSQNPEILMEVFIINSFFHEELVFEEVPEDNMTKNTIKEDIVGKENTQSLDDPTLELDLSAETKKEKPLEVGVVPKEDLDTIGITLTDIQDAWNQVTAEVSKKNKPLESLLRQAVLVSFQDGVLNLESAYKFHTERLSQNTNKLMIEEVLKTVFNQKILYKCSLSTNVARKIAKQEAESLTDYNVVSPKELSGDDLLALFNGGVPITN